MREQIDRVKNWKQFLNENKYSENLSLKFSAEYCPIERVVVIIEIAPPFGFQNVYSPAVGW